jgi:PAS domain S-box-containing protein
MNWFKKYFQKDISKALKEAEEKLRIHENRFRSLIENSLDGIVILSAEGKSLYVSPSIHGILGYSVEDALKMNIFSLSHPDDLPQVSSVLEQVVRDTNGSVHIFTGRMQHRDGKWRWLEAKVRNLLHDPSVRGIVANFTDVTDKKIASEKLLQANRLYSFLSQINKTIVHSGDEGTVFKEACRIAMEYGALDIAWVGSFNMQASKIRVVESAGLSPEEIFLFEQIPDHPAEPQHQVLNGAKYFVCNDLQQSNLTRWKEVAKARNINSIIILPLKKAGEVCGTFNLYSSSVNFFTEQEINLLDEAAQDISFALDVFEKDKQRLEVEKELLHKDLRYRQAQEIAHLGSWELDFSTGKSIWSEEACRIYGVPSTENVQTHDIWLSFIHPDDIDEVSEIVKRAMVTLEDTAFYFRIVRKDGEVRQLFQQSQFVLDEAGKAIGLYGVLHDITEITEAEAAVRESEKALKDMVKFNQSLIEAAPIGIAAFNAKSGTCLSVNAAFATIIGAEQQVLVGLNFREIESWQQSGLLEDANQTIETGEVIQKEILFRSTFGVERWINYRFVRFFDKDVLHLLLLMNDISERKQAEEALRKSEFQFRQIVETAQEGIWRIDKDFLTLFVNKRMCDMLGYSPEEMMGRPVFDYMEAGAREALAASIGRPQDSGKHENVAFLTKKGNRMITQLSSTQFFDEKGDFGGALAMIADVTEKAKLEDLLHKANRISSIGNYEIDLVNEKVYWSDIMREIMEVEPDFVPDLSTTNTFYREGQSNVLINQKVRDLIEKGRPYDEELQIVTQKGNIKWVRTIGEAEFLEGKCLRIYGSFQDIDERKRSQREVLRVYEEKNDILESIADAFYAVDKNWMVTYWNKEAENLLKRNRREMIGKNLWEAYPHLVGSELYRNYIKVAKENTVQQFAMYYDPIKRWFDISVYPSSNGISVYFKDVTESKEWEIQLQNLNKSLENYTKELLVSNKNLEQFSYIVSHNLRTPVANILGLSQILKEESLPEDQKEFVIEELGAAVEALDEVIMDLNLILKKKQEINESKEKVLFSRLVTKVKNSISHVMEAEQVEIITDFSEVDEYLTIKSYLHSIFYNLIVNSIKYRYPGRKPVITITSRRVDGKIILSFEDNGSGIDLEKKGDQLFGLYKRFHTNIEGKGMGLFMVKTQVEVLGGKIIVRSQPDYGTIFELEFPNKPDSEV